MKSIYTILALSVFMISSEAFLFGGDNWNDLKVTWGINPFGSNNFVSLPRTEQEARNKGWVKEKNCSQVNGNRYILKGDKAVLLIFSSSGLIAGIASQIPKGLPYNFPSNAQQQFFDDEGDYFTISAYFIDPATVCKPTLGKQSTGDRLVIKSSHKEVNVPLTSSEVQNFWTLGQCFYTMGVHYWADVTGAPLGEDTNADNFMPVFLMYNKGKLNGFGWAFNAGLSSNRYEHPTSSVLGKFFKSIPKFFDDKTKTGVLSTLHIYFDSTPQLNFC